MPAGVAGGNAPARRSSAHRSSFGIEQVDLVLEEIGAADLPQLRVYNKIDLLDMEPRIDRGDNGAPVAVWLSAQSGAGCDLLLQAIAAAMEKETISSEEVACLLTTIADRMHSLNNKARSP